MNRLFNQHYRNARKAVEQIRAGEWVPRCNSITREHITAERHGMELWLGNGAFSCDIDVRTGGPTYFGHFWRHYVWWAAARKLKRDADKALRRARQPTPVLS